MKAAPKIDLRNLDDLTPDPHNARTHSAEQLDWLQGMIREFGWTSPMLVDDVIRAGNGRYAAARTMYQAGETLYLAPGRDNGGAALPHNTVPVIDCTGWTETQRTAYALGDNQIALQAGWDEARLKGQIDDLAAADFSLPMIGFDDTALNALGLLLKEGATDPEMVPPEPVDPVSILGDIWLLGEHRLGCGSCTDPEMVLAVLAGAKPHLMVTDPPYGVEYDANWRNEAERADGSKIGASAIGKVENDDQADWSETWALFPGDVAYVWHAGVRAPEVADSLTALGFVIRSQIIWAKQVFAIGRGDYHWQHEPCWYAVRAGKKGHWQGSRKQTTVWDIDKPQKSETGHSTQKPVECMKRPIENNSKPGDAIYEPFSGSGTTIIAGEMVGRHVYAVELNPVYVDVAVLRWQGFAGKEARLEATGQTYAETAAARGVSLPA